MSRRSNWIGYALRTTTLLASGSGTWIALNKSSTTSFSFPFHLFPGLLHSCRPSRNSGIPSQRFSIMPVEANTLPRSAEPLLAIADRHGSRHDLWLRWFMQTVGSFHNQMRLRSEACHLMRPGAAAARSLLVSMRMAWIRAEVLSRWRWQLWNGIGSRKVLSL